MSQPGSHHAWLYGCAIIDVNFLQNIVVDFNNIDTLSNSHLLLDALDLLVLAEIQGLGCSFYLPFVLVLHLE